ncbi:MAG: winged helix-turn-helix domain-containing protein [Gammaproteobacteria bacterium]
MSDSTGRQTVYGFGDFRLEPRHRALCRRDGSRVEITAKAFDALLYFVEHAGTIVVRDELMKILWPRTVVEDNSLNKLIAALRRALDDDGQRYLVTVQGRGYQFVADVKAMAEPASAAPRDRELLAPLPPAASARPSGFALRPRALRAVLGAAAFAVVGSYYIWWTSSGASNVPQSPPLGAVTRVLPATSYPGDEASPSLSPDGRQVAFSWDRGAEDAGNRDIYVATLGAATPLRLTDDPAVDQDPAWSPDGTEIAFLRRRGPRDFDIMVAPALGGAERKLHSARLWVDTQLRETAPLLAWSPDSAYVVFTSQTGDSSEAGDYHLYALAITTGAIHSLTNDPDVYDSSPAVSPDGRWLAFSRFQISAGRSSRLMVQRLGRELKPEGRPSVLPSGPTGTPHSPHWSRDSRRVVFLNAGEIRESVVGGESRVVYTASGAPGATRYRGLSLHRDEERSLAVIAVETALADIWAIPVDPKTHEARGAPVRRIASSAVDHHPQFSPDGRSVAFISGRSGRVAVWRARADGGELRQLTDIEVTAIGFPRWSPDGRQLAFHVATPGRNRQIYLLPDKGGIAQPFTGGCCAEWSLDGRYLYSVEIGAADMIVRTNTADGTREPLFEGTLPRLTIDGTRMIYSKTTARGLYARSLAGGAATNPEEKLVDDYTPPLGGTTPTSDGFYYVGLTPAGVPRALRFYDYARHAARDVASLPPRTEQGLSVSPDGRTLLYAASSSSNGDLLELEFE